MDSTRFFLCCDLQPEVLRGRAPDPGAGTAAQGELFDSDLLLCCIWLARGCLEI